MFNLLEDLHELPFDTEDVVAVSQGMNKVRVSVGQHVSEPSEVYILTGRRGRRFETFVVFYMIQPEVLVFYGNDRNPYEEGLREEVVTAAMDMVETMGSILQEVAWEGMPAQAREGWLADQKLLPMVVEAELEEVPEEVEEDAQAAGPDGVEATQSPLAAPETHGPERAARQEAVSAVPVKAVAVKPAEDAADDAGDPLGSLFLRPQTAEAARRRRTAPTPAMTPGPAKAPPEAPKPMEVAAATRPPSAPEPAAPQDFEPPIQPTVPEPTVPLPGVAAIDVGQGATSPAVPSYAAAPARSVQGDRAAILRFLSRV